ncbi:MAG TPA: DUF3515 domain-containing protein [Gaiellales bacterium]|nr:DUF3515 domain-containing protein [Gaiellales bacterium]
MIAIVALNLAGGGSPQQSSPPTGAPGPLSLSAPPHVQQQAGACAKVLAKLPVRVDRLAQRVVHTTPETPFVVAWGDPPVVLRCGVDRPASLHAGSSAQYFSATGPNGPYFDVSSDGQSQVFTSVDRAAYISIAIPAQYRAGPLTPLARAIAAALPPVCTTEPAAPLAQHCTRRQ